MIDVVMLTHERVSACAESNRAVVCQLVSTHVFSVALLLDGYADFVGN